MMKLLCLSFAAVVVASQDVSETVETIDESFSIDLDFLPTEALSNFGSFSEHLKLDISSVLETVKHEDVISAATSFRGLQQQEEGDDDKCEKCVDGAEKWILDFAVKTFEKMCASKPKCPFLKKMCEVNQKHPKVIQGFLFGKVGAHMDAFSYCVGKKECEMPKPPTLGCAASTVDAQDEEDDMSLALRYLDNIFTSGEVMDDDDAAFNQAPEDLDNFVVSPHDCDCGDNRVPDHFFHDKSLTNNPPPPPKCDCICKGCVHHMTKFVLGMTMLKVKKICEHTKCPKVKKMCDWAKSHKEEAVGFLFAKVAPWKGAIGWCYGAGRCMPGHHHHHHHKSTTKAPKADEDESVVA